MRVSRAAYNEATKTLPRSGYCREHGQPSEEVDVAQGTCSIEECERIAKARGWCKLHYDRWARWGDPTIAKVVHGLTWQERIARFIDKRGPDDCWHWTGSMNYGYGYTYLPTDTPGKYRRMRIHRLVYEVHYGPVPEGLDVDHECHNEAARRGECVGGVDCLHRRCANPAHLVARPPGDNTLRSPNTPAGINARKTHCPQGHPYDETNTYISKSGSRSCRTCMSARSKGGAKT